MRGSEASAKGSGETGEFLGHVAKRKNRSPVGLGAEDVANDVPRMQLAFDPHQPSGLHSTLRVHEAGRLTSRVHGMVEH